MSLLSATRKASETLVPVLPVTSISSLDSVYATHFLSVNPDKDSHPSTVPIVEDVNAEPVKRGTEMKMSVRSFKEGQF